MRRALLGLLVYGHTEGLDNLDPCERGRVLALDRKLDLVAVYTGKGAQRRARGTA